MKIILVLFRLVATGLLLAFGARARARETSLELFRPTAALSPREAHEVSAFLSHVENHPPPTDAGLRLAWWTDALGRIPPAMMSFEPVEYAPSIAKVLERMGSFGSPLFGNLLLARLAIEMAQAPPDYRKRTVIGLLDGACKLPLDEDGLPTLSNLVEHLLEDAASRFDVMKILERNADTLERSPDLLELVFTYATRVPKFAKTPLLNTAALRVLSHRPDLLGVDQIDDFKKARLTVNETFWPNGGGGKIQKSIDDLFVSLMKEVARLGKTSVRTEVIEDVFEAENPPSVYERARIRAFLKAVGTVKPRHLMPRAEWWAGVVPFVNSYVSQLYLTKDPRRLGIIFPDQRPRANVRFGKLLVTQMRGEIARAKQNASVRREYVNSMLDSVLRLPRTDQTRATIDRILRDLLLDELTRAQALEALRAHPRVIQSYAIREAVIGVALAEPNERTDLRWNLAAMDILKTQTASLADDQLRALADLGRRLIERRDLVRGDLQRKFAVRESFEAFGQAIQHDPRRRDRFLATIQQARWMPEPEATQKPGLNWAGADDLRINEEEFSPGELGQIVGFVGHVRTLPLVRETKEVAEWWGRVAPRVPESVMNVPIINNVSDLAHVLGVRGRPPPGARFGEVIAARLFEDLFAGASSTRPGLYHVRRMLHAAFQLPVHVVTLVAFGEHIGTLLRSEEYVDVTLNALLNHPRVLKLSRPLRAQVIRTLEVDRMTEPNVRRITLVIQVLAKAASAFGSDELGAITKAMSDVEHLSWSADQMNEIVDAAQLLAFALRGRDVPACTPELVPVARW